MKRHFSEFFNFIFQPTKSPHLWRNNHWFAEAFVQLLPCNDVKPKMALLPLGLTGVWINIPHSYLAFIKHVIGSGPWLIWTLQFVLFHREVRTISHEHIYLFAGLGSIDCEIWYMEVFIDADTGICINALCFNINKTIHMAREYFTNKNDHG